MPPRKRKIKETEIKPPVENECAMELDKKIHQAIKDIDTEVERRCAAIWDAAKKQAETFRMDASLEIKRIPAKVRQMTLAEILNLPIEQAESNKLPGIESLLLAFDAIVNNEIPMTCGQTATRARRGVGCTNPLNTAARETRLTRAQAALQSSSETGTAMTLCENVHEGKDQTPTVANKKPAAVVLPPQTALGPVAPPTVGGSAFLAPNTVAMTILRPNGKQRGRQAAQAMTVTTQDSTQYFITGAETLRAIPQLHRKEVEQQLHAMYSGLKAVLQK